MVDLRGAALVAGASALIVTGRVDAAPPVERQAELLHGLRHDCGSCHGMTMKGGLGPALLPDGLAARNSRELSQIILDGVPRTPMPPWRGLITEDEALWLVERLKEGLDAE